MGLTAALSPLQPKTLTQQQLDDGYYVGFPNAGGACEFSGLSSQSPPGTDFYKIATTLAKLADQFEDRFRHEQRSGSAVAPLTESRRWRTSLTPKAVAAPATSLCTSG